MYLCKYKQICIVTSNYSENRIIFSALQKKILEKWKLCFFSGTKCSFDFLFSTQMVIYNNNEIKGKYHKGKYQNRQVLIMESRTFHLCFNILKTIPREWVCRSIKVESTLLYVLRYITLEILQRRTPSMSTAT